MSPVDNRRRDHSPQPVKRFVRLSVSRSCMVLGFRLTIVSKILWHSVLLNVQGASYKIPAVLWHCCWWSCWSSHRGHIDSPAQWMGLCHLIDWLLYVLYPMFPVKLFFCIVDCHTNYNYHYSQCRKCRIIMCSKICCSTINLGKLSVIQVSSASQSVSIVSQPSGIFRKSLGVSFYEFSDNYSFMFAC